MKTWFMFAFLLCSVPAWAVAPVNTSLFGSVAIKGYDPVAYFTESQPVRGSREFTFVWNEATWQFASASNRNLFAQSPATYAPQFGGYCAWAVSQGYTAGIDPAAWKIVAGKLYLNYDREMQAKWMKDMPGLIEKAETNWPLLLKK